MELLDTTLREGEQCYGVFFSLSVKLKLARLLDQTGVDFIEVGHPAAAPSIAEAAAAIARLGLRSRLIGHSRLNEIDIRSVRKLGLPWVGLFSGINRFSLDRYGLDRAAAFERIRRSVMAAKDLGLSVRFTCEDASRTEPDELVELYVRLRELGVNRISYADTVGIDTPERMRRLARQIGSAVAFSDLHFHFHNDRGRALANAKQAAALGAQCIDASIMGVGERMGVVPLQDMLAWCDGLPATGDAHPFAAVRAAAELVASSIDWSRFQHRQFAHKSGIHIHGVLRDARQYEHADPAQLGGRRLIVLSKLIGRSGLRTLLSLHGFSADSDCFSRLLRRIKTEDRLELADPEDIVRFFESSPECRRASGAEAA